LLGLPRQRPITALTRRPDSHSSIGGSIGGCMYSVLQGVQILRVHDINEINQALKIFKKLQFN
jgi:dihydropteroate synthase